MKKSFLYFLSAGFLLVVFNSCKHEVDVPMIPAISFVNEIRPILNVNCQYSGCHGGENFMRFQLLTYDDVIKNGGIGSGDPLDTKLYKSITGKGADIMPPSSYSPLNDLDIKRILLWMRQGAKYN